MQKSYLLLMAIFSTHWEAENQNKLLRRGRQRIMPHREIWATVTR